MTPGQSRRLRPLACLLLLVAFSLAVSSCTSVYKRTRSELPPDPAEELRMRLTEAEKSESLTRQAGLRLLESLQRGQPAVVTETDFDRLEAAAFELERRVLVVHDAEKPNVKVVDHAAEIESVQRQSHAWLEYVQSSRVAAPATQIQKLQDLLDRPN